MRGKVKAKMHIYMPNVRKVNFKKNGKAIKGLKANTKEGSDDGLNN